MNRTPPVDVRRELRREVNFGWPVDGCGSPYLAYHHFDATSSTDEQIEQRQIETAAEREADRTTIAQQSKECHGCGEQC